MLYAVKCNPEPRVLRAVWAGGVRHFDCASLPEIALVRRLLPRAEVHFMHPVKSRPAIHAAFHQYGVTDFALDSRDELEKILQETVRAELVGTPPVLGLFVRLAVKQGGAYDLSGKFGVAVAEAAELLRLARPHAARLGLCFHVGSQCLDPSAYARAMALAAEAVALSGVAIDIVDVGGGFPVSYPDAVPPPLDDYVAAIGDGGGAVRRRRRLCGPSRDGRWWRAAGRSSCRCSCAAATRSTSMTASMAASATPGIPASAFRRGASRWTDAADGETKLRAFALYGPTCDSADYMKGPFLLPEDIDEGDWIELGQLGAYGACLRTRFNGFDSTLTAEVADPPLLATPGYDG